MNSVTQYQLNFIMWNSEPLQQNIHIFFFQTIHIEQRFVLYNTKRINLHVPRFFCTALCFPARKMVQSNNFRLRQAYCWPNKVSVFSLVTSLIVYRNKFTFQVHLPTFELVSGKNFTLHVALHSFELAVCEMNFVHSKLCTRNMIAKVVSCLTVLSLVTRLSKITIRILTSLICKYVYI